MMKIFFDTNFLLRFYIADVPSQAARARKFVEAAIAGSLALVTDLIVICEMVWVLDSFYKLKKKEIQAKIMNLYETPGIQVLRGEVLPEALALYVDKNLDFTDALVAVCTKEAGIKYIASFDRKHMNRVEHLGLTRIETIEEIT
jgi:predicted nucleic-acid-binding protein